MSHRPTDWHILGLDQDPTPGDPQRIRKLAGTLHDFADDVADALRDLKGIAKEDEILSWAGKTAEVGPAARTYGVEDVPVAEGDSRMLRMVLTQTYVPVPGTTDQVVLISGASPVLDLAEAFHDIFDAVTSTFRII